MPHPPSPESACASGLPPHTRPVYAGRPAPDGTPYAARMTTVGRPGSLSATHRAAVVAIYTDAFPPQQRGPAESLFDDGLWVATGDDGDVEAFSPALCSSHSWYPALIRRLTA